MEELQLQLAAAQLEEERAKAAAKARMEAEEKARRDTEERAGKEKEVGSPAPSPCLSVPSFCIVS